MYYSDPTNQVLVIDTVGDILMDNASILDAPGPRRGFHAHSFDAGSLPSAVASHGGASFRRCIARCTCEPAAFPGAEDRRAGDWHAPALAAGSR